MIVAIDGPAAAGKGTLARRIAAHYGLSWLDTGALYRAVALRAIETNTAPDDDARLCAFAEALDAETLDDPALRSAAVGAAASRIAARPAVRAALLTFQRDFAARRPGAVLDGRDIGSVICPHAEVKLFVTAAPAARAARRARELREAGFDVDEAALAADLAERDRRDSERADAPLRPAEGAILLDTSEMTIDAAFDAARRAIDAALAQRSTA